MGRSAWQDWVNLVLSVWLFLSPWVLGFSLEQTPAWNAWVVAVIAAIAAVVSLGRHNPQSQWVMIVVGAWLIVSPWVLQAAALAPGIYWNLVIVGIAFIVFAAWNIMGQRPPRRA